MPNSLRPHGRQSAAPPARPADAGPRSASPATTTAPSARRRHGARPGQPAKQRDAYFDNAKYLAIVLVAVGHAWEPLTDGSRAAGRCTWSSTPSTCRRSSSSPATSRAVFDMRARPAEAAGHRRRRAVRPLRDRVLALQAVGGRRPDASDQPARPLVPDLVPGRAVHLAADHPAVEGRALARCRSRSPSRCSPRSRPTSATTWTCSASCSSCRSSCSACCMKPEHFQLVRRREVRLAVRAGVRRARWSSRTGRRRGCSSAGSTAATAPRRWAPRGGPGS